MARMGQLTMPPEVGAMTGGGSYDGGQKMSKSIQSSENQRVERVKSVEQKPILSSSAFAFGFCW